MLLFFFFFLIIVLFVTHLGILQWTYNLCELELLVNKITAKNGFTRPKLFHLLVAINGSNCSIFGIFEESDYVPRLKACLASFILACIFIAKAISMNFTEDRDVGIHYLSAKFELDRFTNGVTTEIYFRTEKNRNIHKHTH